MAMPTVIKSNVSVLGISECPVKCSCEHPNVIQAIYWGNLLRQSTRGNLCGAKVVVMTGFGVGVMFAAAMIW